MGFETIAFISQPVDDNVCCPLCLEVFESPVTTCLEGHVLCKACFEKLRAPKDVESGQDRGDRGSGEEAEGNNRNSARTAKCPQCRGDLVDEALPNRPLQSIILQMLLRCESRSTCADSGCARTCTWEGTVEQYVSRHRPTCQHTTFVYCEVCAVRVQKCCIEAHVGSAECRASRAQIRRNADEMVDALEASGETVEEKAEVLLETLISDEVWPTSLRIGEVAGVTYMSPEEYSLMASTEMGGIISTLLGGKAQITEEEARTFFVKCMLGRINANSTEGGTEG